MSDSNVETICLDQIPMFDQIPMLIPMLRCGRSDSNVESPMSVESDIIRIMI